MINFVRLLPITISLFFLTACQQGCPNKADPVKTVEPVQEVKEEPNAKNTAPIERFDSLNLSQLNQSQVASFTKMLNEEICPCGCPKTFAQCLQMKPGCKVDQLLAQWAADRLKEGAPDYLLYKAISQDLNAGFLAEAKVIDTKNAYFKGKAGAAVVIVEFADFECPACKIASKEFKEFVKENSNDVQVFFMHSPLSTHPHAEHAAVAAEAAGKQGKFWEMHDLLFAYDGPLTPVAIKELATRIFSMKQLAQFEKDLLDPALSQKVKEQKDYSINELKLMGTPTFFFNGRPYQLSTSKDGYQLRFDMEKLRAGMSCQ